MFFLGLDHVYFPQNGKKNSLRGTEQAALQKVINRNNSFDATHLNVKCKLLKTA